MSNTKLFLFDLETTGLDTNTAEVIQAAYITLDLEDVNGTIKTFSQFFKPSIPIPPEVSGVTNIDDVDVENEEPFVGSNAFKAINQFAEEGYIAVAHNAKYDLGVLESHDIHFQNEICTLKLAQYLYKELGNHKLGTLRAFYKLPKPEGDLHDALVDTKLLVNVFLTMLKKEYGNDIEEMRKGYSEAREDLLGRWPFGKHKGQKIDPIEHGDYMRWFLGTPDDPKKPKDPEFVDYLKSKLDEVA